MLHGKAIIDLHNNRTHLDTHIEHDNMVTSWLEDITSQLWMYDIYAPKKFQTLNADDVFGGIMLFEHPLGTDADDYWFPSPTTNRMVAHGNHESYAGADLTRGSFNAGQSSWGSGSITRVWDFTNEQGNGTIASLGLCSKRAGFIGSGQPTMPESSAVGKFADRTYSQVIGGISNTDNRSYNACYVTEGCFYWMYLTSNGTLKVIKCNAPWNMYRPTRYYVAQNTVTSLGYNVLATSDNLSETTYDLSSALGTINCSVAFVSDSGKLYLISGGPSAWSNGTSRTLVIFDIVAGTYTTKTVTNNTGHQLHTYNNSNQTNIGQMAVKGDYLYLLTQENPTKLAFINLTDNTDCGLVLAPDGVSDFTFPRSYTSAPGGNSGLDVYGNMLIVHDSSPTSSLQWTDVVYVIVEPDHSLYLDAYALNANYYNVNKVFSCGKINNAYTFVYGHYNTSYNQNELNADVLPCLTTKNNLESAVTKTADMTMRVTYTVTEGGD